MTKEELIKLCEKWIADGYGDECFWEGWPECPTPDTPLTPNQLLTFLNQN